MAKLAFGWGRTTAPRVRDLRRSLGYLIDDKMSELGLDDKKKKHEFADKHYQEMDYNAPETLETHLDYWRKGKPFSGHSTYRYIDRFSPLEVKRILISCRCLGISPREPAIRMLEKVGSSSQ